MTCPFGEGKAKTYSDTTLKGIRDPSQIGFLNSPVICPTTITQAYKKNMVCRIRIARFGRYYHIPIVCILIISPGYLNFVSQYELHFDKSL